MPKHIIIAESAEGADRQYVASSSHSRLTADITDSALFASEAAATTAVKKLLTRDFEREHKVVLSLGTVTFELTETKPVRRAARPSGFVIRRMRGDYYRGPKSRAPRDFHDAYYSYIQNRDAATIFPSADIAEAYGHACREILRETAERDEKSSKPSSTYRTLYIEFEFTIEAV